MAKTDLTAGGRTPRVPEEGTWHRIGRDQGPKAADAHRGAEQIAVAHPSMTTGDPCHVCGNGNVYQFALDVWMWIAEQAPLLGDGHRAPLFLSGRLEAGEKLPQVLNLHGRASAQEFQVSVQARLPWNQIAPLDNNVCERALNKAILDYNSAPKA